MTNQLLIKQIAKKLQSNFAHLIRQISTMEDNGEIVVTCNTNNFEDIHYDKIRHQIVAAASELDIHVDHNIDQGSQFIYLQDKKWLAVTVECPALIIGEDVSKIMISLNRYIE